jgi:hypothetical protein
VPDLHECRIALLLLTLASTASEFSPDMYVPGYLAASKLCLVIANRSLYTFLVFADLVLVCCFCILLYCWVWGGIAPNLSAFPEWDFTSRLLPTSSTKEAREDNWSMEKVTTGLGNADTKIVKDRMKAIRIYLGVKVEEGEKQLVTFVTKDGVVSPLESSQLYV